ncbi:uncharacterized protein LOC131640500 isoform X4 [Vicia villosa]|uniref:uncharacterized protein LOC131640500 isoform X4 n=1 Tax=Vicia villosa TaxID=3911 RepID=UPI00273B514F|nr:uncharacterized protein LOC131640500 isoform X4 [Vicia villosa]
MEEEEEDETLYIGDEIYENGSSQKAEDLKLKEKRKREREKNMPRKKLRKLEAAREMLEDEEQNDKPKGKGTDKNEKSEMTLADLAYRRAKEVKVAKRALDSGKIVEKPQQKSIKSRKNSFSRTEEMWELFQTDKKDKKSKQRGSGVGKKPKKSFKSKSRYLNMKIQGRGARRSQESDHSQLQPSPLRDIGVHIDQNKRQNQRRGRSDQPKSSQLCTSPAAPPPVTSFYKASALGRRRKLNVVHHKDQSLEKEKSTTSSNEVTNEGSHNESHCEKRTRGYSHMLDVWDMPAGNFILVDVDHMGNPIGWEGKTLLNAIGSLVRRHQCAPINYVCWSDMPEKNITDMLELIQTKFRFVPEFTERTEKILKDNMSIKWRQFKYHLKSKGYDGSKKEEEMASYIPDRRVDPSQYRDLVHYWCSEDGQKISGMNKMNRKKYEDIHCMGTKNLPSLIHEMTTKAGGVQPSRAQIYIDTRTRKDGSIVTESAAYVIEELKKHMVEEEGSSHDSQATKDSTSWKNDSYSKVKGPEKRGRVRCLGKLPRHASSSSNADNRVATLENLLGNLVSVLQMRFSEDPQVNEVLRAIAEEV